MTKKDYELAAQFCQDKELEFDGPVDAIVDTFAAFFARDNPRFDEARFRAACVPGANVRARPKKAHRTPACPAKTCLASDPCVHPGGRR